MTPWWMMSKSTLAQVMACSSMASSRYTSKVFCDIQLIAILPQKVLINLIRDPLQWRHYGCDRVSNHQRHHCLLNRIFRRWSKKTSKLRVTGLCAGNSPGTSECEFPAQMASNAENVSIWWRYHATRQATIEGVKFVKAIPDTTPVMCDKIPPVDCTQTNQRDLPRFDRAPLDKNKNQTLYYLFPIFLTKIHVIF